MPASRGGAHQRAVRVLNDTKIRNDGKEDPSHDDLMIHPLLSGWQFALRQVETHFTVFTHRATPTDAHTHACITQPSTAKDSRHTSTIQDRHNVTTPLSSVIDEA